LILDANGPIPVAVTWLSKTKLIYCYEKSHFLVTHFSATTIAGKLAGWPFCQTPNSGQNGHPVHLPPIVVTEK
jgi:hypothetical protein